MKNITFVAARHIMFMLAFILVPFLSLNAQNSQRNDLESFRVAFITNELKLSSDESQRFWPVYSEYLQELSRLRTSNANSNDDDTDTAYQQAKSNLRQRYISRLKTAIPEAKVNELPKAEKEFKRWLLTKAASK